jgi:hypothetical protein
MPRNRQPKDADRNTACSERSRCSLRNNDTGCSYQSPSTQLRRPPQDCLSCTMSGDWQGFQSHSRSTVEGAGRRSLRLVRDCVVVVAICLDVVTDRRTRGTPGVFDGNSRLVTRTLIDIHPHIDGRQRAVDRRTSRRRTARLQPTRVAKVSTRRRAIAVYPFRAVTPTKGR